MMIMIVYFLHVIRLARLANFFFFAVLTTFSRGFKLFLLRVRHVHCTVLSHRKDVPWNHVSKHFQEVLEHLFFLITRQISQLNKQYIIKLLDSDSFSFYKKKHFRIKQNFTCTKCFFKS